MLRISFPPPLVPSVYLHLPPGGVVCGDGGGGGSYGGRGSGGGDRGGVYGGVHGGGRGSGNRGDACGGGVGDLEEHS